MLAPAILVGAAFQAGIYAAWNALGEGPQAQAFADIFPEHPRIAVAAGAASLLFAGLVTVSWGKVLQRAGARMTFLLLPWAVWGRVMSGAAVIIFVAGMIAPESTLALFASPEE